MLCGQPQIRRELDGLFEILEDRVSYVAPRLEKLAEVSLHVHARYTRIEILAACGVGEGVWVAPWQTDVRYVEALPADLLAFTLDRIGGASSLATGYRDCAVSRERIHWEGQSVARADGEAGRREREHVERGNPTPSFRSGDWGECTTPQADRSHRRFVERHKENK